MTETRNSINPTETAKPEKLNLSATQVIASGMAAISSTVAASYFGVAGTVIGAAFGAVITVVGNAVYGHYLRRTRNRVLDLAVSQRFSTNRTRDISIDSAGHVSSESAPTKPARTPMRWQPKRLALAAGGLFVVLMAATTGFELASGQPLSATVSGNHGSGASAFGGTESKKTTPTPTVSSSTSSNSSTSTEPSSASPTVTVTETPSTSPSPTDSSTPTDSGSASSSPTESSTGTGSSTPTPTPTPSG